MRTSEVKAHACLIIRKARVSLERVSRWLLTRTGFLRFRRDWQDAIARVEVIVEEPILDENGAVSVRDTVRRGTAFLVSRGLVLTALHVVADHTTNPPRFFTSKGPPTLYFPGRTVLAKKEHPPGTYYDTQEDWVLLECERPPGRSPLPLDRNVTRGSSWSSYGFPDTKIDGLGISGHVTATNVPTPGGAAAIQLTLMEGRQLHPQGYSGAPVVIDGAAVGILRWTIPQERGGVVADALFATTMEAVLKSGAGGIRDRRSGVLGALRRLKWMWQDFWSYDVRIGPILMVIILLVLLPGVSLVGYWPEEWHIASPYSRDTVSFNTPWSAKTAPGFRGEDWLMVQQDPNALQRIMMEKWKEWTQEKWVDSPSMVFLVATSKDGFDTWHKSFWAAIEVNCYVRMPNAGKPPPALAASTAGLVASPFGNGPLLAATALVPGKIATPRIEGAVVFLTTDPLPGEAARTKTYRQQRILVEVIEQKLWCKEVFLERPRKGEYVLLLLRLRPPEDPGQAGMPANPSYYSVSLRKVDKS